MNLTLGCHLIPEGGVLGGDLTLQAFCDQSGFGVRVWDCHLGKLRTSKKLPNYEICHYAKEELVFLDVCTIRGATSLTMRLRLRLPKRNVPAPVRERSTASKAGARKRGARPRARLSLTRP